MTGECVPLVILTAQYTNNKLNTLQLWIFFSAEIDFSDTVSNALTVFIDNKSVPFSLVMVAEQKVIVEFETTQ